MGPVNRDGEETMRFRRGGLLDLVKHMPQSCVDSSYVPDLPFDVVPALQHCLDDPARHFELIVSESAGLSDKRQALKLEEWEHKQKALPVWQRRVQVVRKGGAVVDEDV